MVHVKLLTNQLI